MGCLLFFGYLRPGWKDHVPVVDWISQPCLGVLVLDGSRMVTLVLGWIQGSSRMVLTWWFVGWGARSDGLTSVMCPVEGS